MKKYYFYALTALFFLLLTGAVKAKTYSITYSEYAPFYFTSENGDVRGFLPDIWRLWAEKTGNEVVFKTLKWKEGIEAVGRGDIDIHGGLYYTPGRSEILDYSTPFHRESSAVFYRKDKMEPLTPERMAGVRTGVVVSDYAEKGVAQKYPEAEIVRFDAYPEMLREFRTGGVDTIAMEIPAVINYIEKYNLHDVAGILTPYLHTDYYRAAVKKGDSELLNIVNNGLSRISEGEMQGLLQKWMHNSLYTETRIPDSIKVAVAEDIYPFEYRDDKGMPAGILVDYWRLWSSKTGIEVSFELSTWSRSLNNVHEGKAHAHAGLVYTKERDKYLDYGIVMEPTRAAVFSSNPAVKVPLDLGGLTLGALKDDFIIQYLKANHKEISFIEYPRVEDLLKAVQDRHVSFFTLEEDVAAHYMSKDSSKWADIAATSRESVSAVYQPAVKEGYSSLLDEVNRGMKLITNHEKNAIRDRYPSLKDLSQNTLEIAVSSGYPPFSSADVNGRPSGILVDFWKLWSKKTGNRIRFRMSSWSETVEDIRTGKVDIHSALFTSSSRREFIDFSQPVLKVQTRFFYNPFYGKPDSSQTFKGVRVGTVSGSFQHEYLKNNYPEATIVTYSDDLSMVKGAILGEVSLILGEEPVIRTILMKEGVAGSLKPDDRVLFTNHHRAGIAKGNAEMMEVVNEGINLITREELDTIISRWLPYHSETLSNTQLSERFTAKELDFIRRNPVIRVGMDPDWPPFEYRLDNGTFTGMSTGFMEMVTRKTGMIFEPVDADNWQEVIEMGENGELDAYTCALKTPERSRYMDFTEPYLSFPVVIFTGTNHPFVGDLDDLYGSRIGVIRGFAITEMLRDDHPAFNYIEFENLKSLLNALASGQVDAYVGNLASVSYMIKQNGFANIKAAAPTDYRFELRFGARKDWPELISIVQKSLNTISEAEQNEIFNKWISITYERRINREEILRIAVPAGAFLLFIVLTAFFWNRQTRKREERFRQLTYNSADMISVINAEREFMFASSAFFRFTGYSPKELRDKKLDDFLHEDEDSLIRLKLNKISLEEEHSLAFTYRFRKADGSWIICESTAANHLRTPAIGGIILNTRDVTDRVQTEEELRRAKLEAEKATRAKTEFLASMSHEIRTPMNAIQGMAELLNSTELTLEQKRYVQVFNSASDNLLTIVNDILDITKIEAGQVDIVNEEFDIITLGENVCDFFAYKAHDKGLDLSCRIDPELKTHYTGDVQRIRQVLVNLMGNAYKFTQKGEIFINIFKDRDSVAFAVEDTGIGIPPNKLTDIFERFSQVDSSIRKRYGGTGLGLSISKHLAELMGGTIDVRSKQFSGSRFCFSVPLKPASDDLVADRSRLDLSGRSILVVHESPHAGDALVELLSSWGAYAEYVPGIDGALMRIEVLKPDTVLCDSASVHNSEAEAMDTFRSFAGSFRLVALCSSFQCVSDLEVMADLRLNSLSKPVRRGELAALLSDAQSSPYNAEQSYELDSDAKGITLLVVDDSEYNRFVVESYIKDTGWSMDIAENGREAVDMFRNREYDAVLMDMQMPVMDGYTATEEIRRIEQSEGRNPSRVIAMTAYALREDQDKCLSAGCDMYLAKPIRRNELISAVSGSGGIAEEKGAERENMDGNEIYVRVPDDFKEIAPRYLDAVKGKSSEAVEALEKGDYDSIHIIGHSMKGEGSAFGFDKISQYGAEIQFAADNSDHDGVKKATDALIDYLDRVRLL
ncbi:transporter substrate-binding domain-containing protein [Limisalsivibrio acetivorans]|uniref:transporter substrate-binding domain-containing protein n=1 Tax=Limisalsivibrio acetivorans TaxID=1304888 RepID=UPI0003B4163C|nr:transporter substrate-binding domain-containing protein [Limisalsivibrio acetivorans]